MNVDVLAVGAHPDDVEIGCGATLALLASQGRTVGILHLTAGEAGTRGTPEQRREEAAAAADVLGVAELRFLDCGDGGLRHGRLEEDSLIEVLRSWRPELVLGPPPRDRHPDHGRAHELVRDACFYAGLAKRAPDVAGPPHRPGALFSYMGHDLATPTFIVDVGSTWEQKRTALEAYQSQLHQPGSLESSLPATKASSPEFLLAIEGRDRQAGMLIGASYGEAFFAAGPLAVTSPWLLVSGGLR